jgi:hypothetical protein
MAAATNVPLLRNHQWRVSDSLSVAAWRSSNTPALPAAAALAGSGLTLRTLRRIRGTAATIAAPSRPSRTLDRSSLTQSTATSRTPIPRRRAIATISTSQARCGSRDQGRTRAHSEVAATFAPHWVSEVPGARVSCTSPL